MNTKKTRLSHLSNQQIESITKHAEKRSDVPLVKTRQVNMRIDTIHLERLRVLAEKTGEKYTTFLTRLLIEDIDRMWGVLKRNT